MEHSQKLNEAAEALLKEYGYNVDIVLDRVGNDRDFDPDYVLCRLAKDGQLKGTVKESYLSGKDVLVDVIVGEQSMRAYVDADLEVKEHDVIGMNFKDKGVFVFDEETGERYV